MRAGEKTIPYNEDEKLRIYLTDVVRGRKAGRVTDLSQEIMLTVSEWYKTPHRAEGFRKSYGMTDIHKAGIDSGGFQFLMGKLKGMPMELLPCGVPVPVDASKTIDLYKRFGAQPQDLPIQLDLPPRWDLPKQTRRELITKSAMYYWEMVEEIPWTVPTIHGWTLDEIQYNLELVSDPDNLAAGTNLGARKNWLMGNMNPHDGRVAAGTFNQPKKSAVDSINGMWGRNRKNKPVGVGSYKALSNSTDYLLHTDNPANPQREKLRRERLASSVPGSMDLRKTTAFVDRVKSRHPKVAVGTFNAPAKSAVDYVHSTKKVVAVGTNIAERVQRFNPKRKAVATPAPGKLDAGLVSPDNMPQVAAPRKRRVAAEGLSSGSQFASIITGTKRASYKVIIDRIAMVLNFLRDDYDVFMLGGASPHTQHQVFLAGAKWTDTSAWRIKAMLGEIYLPEHSSGHNAFGIGYSQKTKRMDEEAVAILKDCLADPRHPYSGMYWKDFMEVGHMLMPQWKKLAIKKNYPARPFVLRALHNAYVLKCREEEIANEFAADPDRYYKYLTKRLRPRPILSKRLRSLFDRIQRPYVQSDLRVYMNSRKGK